MHLSPTFRSKISHLSPHNFSNITQGSLDGYSVRNQYEKYLKDVNKSSRNQQSNKSGHITDYQSSMTLSLTQRDIINLIDRCPQLMREDKLFLRNRVKNYFKDLGAIQTENKHLYDGAIQSNNDISQMIEILATCKKPLDKIHLYENHMHWLQVKLRKYATYLQKKKKQQTINEFKKNKRQTLENQHKKLASHAPTCAPTSTRSVKRKSEKNSSINFYKRFKQSAERTSRSRQSLRASTKFSQQKYRKSTQGSEYGKKTRSNWQRNINLDSQKRKSSKDSWKMQKSNPSSCKNHEVKKWPKDKAADRAVLFRSKQKQQNKKQKIVYNHDIDDLSQINKKSSMLDQEENIEASPQFSNHKVKEDHQYHNYTNVNLKVQENQPHFCSMVEKQECKISEWSKQLAVQNYPPANPPISRNYNESQISELKVSNNRIDQILAESRRLVQDIESRMSPQIFLSPETNQKKMSSDQAGLFTSPEMLQQCRKFIASSGCGFHEKNEAPNLQTAYFPIKKPRLNSIGQVIYELFGMSSEKYITANEVEAMKLNCEESLFQQYSQLFSYMSYKNTLSFEEVINHISEIDSTFEGNLSSKSVFQLFDLDGKGFVVQEDFEVFVENLKASQVNDSIIENIQNIIQKYF